MNSGTTCEVNIEEDQEAACMDSWSCSHSSVDRALVVRARHLIRFDFPATLPVFPPCLGKPCQNLKASFRQVLLFFYCLSINVDTH